EAWRWSWGVFAPIAGQGPLTTGEMRKMTGKAADIAAVLTRLPLDMDYFKVIEDDLVEDGALKVENRAWICSVLRQLPLLATQYQLRESAFANLDWLAEQLMESGGLDRQSAAEKAQVTLASLFAGWQDPVLRYVTAEGKIENVKGVPLRAMVAYLFGEVAKNFHLIHHTSEWIECVSLSQLGDCSVKIDPERLPSRAEMESKLEWEKGVTGPDLLDLWLERHGAVPFDFNQDLDDASLSPDNPPEFHRLRGTNFFRGLALIDLAEAMLKRAFGAGAVAVRVNAAGQGDYFQVHVDSQAADPEQVKRFIEAAFYRRFGLDPEPEFVELHPGGGAAGIRLSRYNSLTQLVHRLRAFEPR
ncbi:MAG: hypothetical protein ABFD86_10515, partial [Bryobacteraceae bacterium]